jgi:hypothetical protein
VLGAVTIRERNHHTFGGDVKEMLQRRLTLDAATTDFESAFERVQKRAAAVAKNVGQLVVEWQTHLDTAITKLGQPAPIRMAAIEGMHWLVTFVAGLSVALLPRWLS